MSTPVSSGPTGQVVSGSGNIAITLDIVCDYNNSYNSLQAYLTTLLANLSTASANITTAFQTKENAGSMSNWQQGGTLWQIENVTAAQFGNDNSKYSAWMSKMQTQYQAESAAMNAQVKVLDTMSSQVQNTLSSLTQSSQNNIQLMGTCVGWTQNLTKLLSN